MSRVVDLIQTLSRPQQDAVGLIKLALDCFNSADGSGLFSGVDRYAVLAGRIEICAAQARDLAQFWALLLRRMQWPVPPKHRDSAIVEALTVGSPRDVLRVLATETASVVTLARMLHDQDKASRRAQRADTGEIMDDTLEDL